MKKQLKMALLAAAVAVGGLMAVSPSADAAYCRPYVQTYTVNGVTQSVYRTACTPATAWYYPSYYYYPATYVSPYAYAYRYYWAY